jgi:hypothetical protein
VYWILTLSRAWKCTWIFLTNFINITAFFLVLKSHHCEFTYMTRRLCWDIWLVQVAIVQSHLGIFAYTLGTLHCWLRFRMWTIVRDKWTILQGKVGVLSNTHRALACVLKRHLGIFSNSLGRGFNLVWPLMLTATSWFVWLSWFRSGNFRGIKRWHSCLDSNGLSVFSSVFDSFCLHPTRVSCILQCLPFLSRALCNWSRILVFFFNCLIILWFIIRVWHRFFKLLQSKSQHVFLLSF